MATRRPAMRRGDDSFVKMTRSFESDMENCSLVETGLMSLLITSRSINPVGVVYRRFEWSELPASSTEQIDNLLGGLEEKGKIVRVRNDILLRSWLRWNAFAAPNMLKAARYSLQHQVTDPLFRTVIATEMLRKNVAQVEVKEPSRGSTQNASRTYSKGRAAHYEAAQMVWTELVEQELPPAETMDGSTREPNPVMLDQIVNCEDFREALPELQRRNWRCVQPEIASALRTKLGTGGIATLVSNH